MALLSSFGKEGVKLNLLRRRVDIEDTKSTSKYFAITEFPKVFTAGKNSFAFNGTSILKDKSEVLIECLDSAGNSLYIEQAKAKDTQFTDASKFVVSVHVYDEAYNGPAKVILVGTTKRKETVRWIGNLTIDKSLDNVSKVRFVGRPSLEVRPLLYPVVSLERAVVDYPPPPVISQATGHADIYSRVYSATVTAIGAGYTSATVTFNNAGTGGTGAAGYAVIAPDESISGVVITNGGNGYIVAPKIDIGGVYTTKASAVAVLRSTVISVTVDTPGAGYTFDPEVVFTPTDGHGAGALATATIVGGQVTGVEVNNGGDGYTYAPLVTFEIPDAPPPPNMNVLLNFSASFTTYAGTPLRDSNKNTVNPKQTDIDYRLTIANSAFVPLTPSDFGSNTYPSKVFNSQMEGREITLHITRVKQPYSTQSIPVNLTSSFVIKKVLSSNTAQLTEPFYYTVGTNQFVADITEGRCFVNYRYVLYNTAPDSSQLFQISPTISVPVKESYAEVVYRNIKCFTGYVARHKLYRKSSFYPGDFQLISDELLTPPEILTDQVTFNRFYDKMGKFYNQPHVDKYWFPETANFTLTHTTSPINAMVVEMGSYSDADGNSGILLKTDTIGGVNDNIYRPYDENQYNRLSGSSYNSNFISLKKDVLYVLGVDMSLRKDVSESAGVEFYFTSSIASIRSEKTYTPRFGMKLGEVSTSDKTTQKYFNTTQYIYFTPANDYFGTLVVVPKKCSPTLANISLKVYGDNGFSPDANDIRIPFEVNTSNEAFDIKAELLDINSTVIYSKLQTIQSFDADGESLYGKTNTGTINTVITINQQGTYAGRKGRPDVTVQGQPYFPDLTQCDDTIRMVGWHVPHGDDEDGKLCYTNVTRLYISSSEYIVLHEYQSGIEHVAKSIAVEYDFDNNLGRKIFVDASGNKETFP